MTRKAVESGEGGGVIAHRGWREGEAYRNRRQTNDAS